MQKHRKPLQDTPSPFLIDVLGRADFRPDKVAKQICLDTPCGFGRNSRYLSRRFGLIIAADRDRDVLSDRWYKGYSNVCPTILDIRHPLPFMDRSVDLAIVIHYYDLSIVKNMSKLLKGSGLLILETPGNYGDNWKDLPKLDEFQNLLKQYFVPVVFVAKRSRVMPNYASVRVMARKIEGTDFRQG